LLENVYYVPAPKKLKSSLNIKSGQSLSASKIKHLMSPDSKDASMPLSAHKTFK